MRRVALLGALLALAIAGGTARADTFAVVPSDAVRGAEPDPERLAGGAGAAPEAARGAGDAVVCTAPRALAASRSGLRHPVAGARIHQQDRVELRPQHGAELGRGDRLDAVHAGHVAPLGRRRGRRRHRRPVEPEGRRVCRRSVPRGRRRDERPLPRSLRLQPCRLVRERGSLARRCLRRRPNDRVLARPAPGEPRRSSRGGVAGRRPDRRPADGDPPREPRRGALAGPRRPGGAPLRPPRARAARRPRARTARRRRGEPRRGAAEARDRTAGSRPRAAGRRSVVVRSGRVAAPRRPHVLGRVRVPGRRRPRRGVRLANPP